MSRFATIRRAQQFRKITYYSINFEDEDQSLFLQFIKNHKGSEHAEPMAIIRSWLGKLGKEIGADARYFRFEAARGGDARALPPPARYIHVDCQLRLYCMHINERVVILFNGGQKTTMKAQDCDNVRPHFLLANKLTQAIDRAIKDGDICFDERTNDLIFDPELILEI